LKDDRAAAGIASGGFAPKDDRATAGIAQASDDDDPALAERAACAHGESLGPVDDHPPYSTNLSLAMLASDRVDVDRLLAERAHTSMVGPRRNKSGLAMRTPNCGCLHLLLAERALTQL
jgi:hypothetical protein